MTNIQPLPLTVTDTTVVYTVCDVINEILGFEWSSTEVFSKKLGKNPTFENLCDEMQAEVMAWMKENNVGFLAPCNAVREQDTMLLVRKISEK